MGRNTHSLGSGDTPFDLSVSVVEGPGQFPGFFGVGAPMDTFIVKEGLLKGSLLFLHFGHRHACEFQRSTFGRPRLTKSLLHLHECRLVVNGGGDVGGGGGGIFYGRRVVLGGFLAAEK